MNIVRSIFGVLSHPKHEFLVDRGPNGDLAGSDVILLSRFDRKAHPPDNMDYSIDPYERSQLDPRFDELVDYINSPSKHLLVLGFL